MYNIDHEEDISSSGTPVGNEGMGTSSTLCSRCGVSGVAGRIGGSRVWNLNSSSDDASSSVAASPRLGEGRVVAVDRGVLRVNVAAGLGEDLSVVVVVAVVERDLYRRGEQDPYRRGRAADGALDGGGVRGLGPVCWDAYFFVTLHWIQGAGRGLWWQAWLRYPELSCTS